MSRVKCQNFEDKSYVFIFGKNEELMCLSSSTQQNVSSFPSRRDGQLMPFDVKHCITNMGNMTAFGLLSNELIL